MEYTPVNHKLCLQIRWGLHKLITKVLDGDVPRVELLGKLPHRLVRVLVCVRVDVSLVCGEGVEEGHGASGVGVHDPNPTLRRVVRGDTPVHVLLVKVPNLL